MNHLAQPAPKVEAAMVGNAPRVEEAKTDHARVVEPATVEKAKAVGPAVLFDGKRDAPTAKEATKERGISVKALRGTTGADFESVAALLRGAPKKNFLKKYLSLFFDERDFVSFGEVKRFVIIKGECCFVFLDDSDIQPLYAIPLDEVNAIMEDPKCPDKFSVTISPTSTNGTKDDFKTVLLKYCKDGSHAYQVTFDISKDASAAKRFFDVVQHSTKTKTVTSSIFHAKAIGKEAAKAQPTNDR
mmetsp:Transcript_6257/g.10358  ORF Transcript_6257/g.10358 Transcript_6257/m.10358 type:complete len:244 (+) Transcript_6257:93-824(+)